MTVPPQDTAPIHLHTSPSAFCMSPSGSDQVDPAGAAMNPPTESVRKRKGTPHRSASSEMQQAAGVLFRLSPAAIVEPIGVGGWEGNESTFSSTLFLAGKPVPPTERDYGFGYASRRSDAALTNGHDLSIGADSGRPSPGDTPSPSRSSDPYEGDERESSTQQSRSNMSTGSRGRGRRPAHASHPRVCISCGATKTPYWREAWAPTVLLCNACGLRFSKFRRRCLDCSYVPRKEDKGSRSCTKCGGPWS